ncbi:MAG: hypothetical protein H0Z34_00510 [Brevibacillus sp.]|nr:hypothetical protein [Brevibacillus sp.]
MPLGAVIGTSSVTFFVGENGSGKSTLLEGIARQCGFPLGGGGRYNHYDLHKAESTLGEYLRLSWLPKVTDIDQVSGDYRAYGGKSLLEQSHGESFLSLFLHRFGRKGIYPTVPGKPRNCSKSHDFRCRTSGKEVSMSCQLGKEPQPSPSLVCLFCC